MTKLLAVLILLSGYAMASASFTDLTHDGSSAGTTSYTTASVTPTANNVVLFATAAHLPSGNGPQPVSSVAGDGLTWSAVATLDYGQAVGTAQANRLEIWCGIGASPSTGALTLTWSTSPTRASWSVSQSTGAVASCTGAFTSNKASNHADVATASPLTVTMGGFASVGNATFAVGAVDAGGQSVAPGAGMTEISAFTTLQEMLETEFAVGNVSPATASYGGPSVRWGIIGLEVVSANSAPTRRAIAF